MSRPISGDYGTIQDLKRTISDMSASVDAERAKVRQREQERVATLEERQQASLQKVREDADETVKNAKENALLALEDERDNSRQQIEQFRQKTYDRFGKMRVEDQETARTQADHFAQENERLAEQARMSQRDQSEVFLRKMDEQEIRHGMNVEDQLQQQKGSFAQDRTQAKESMERLQTTLKNDYAHMRSKLEDNHDQQLHKIDQSYSERADRDAAANSKSRAIENRELREKVRSIRQVEDDAKHEKAIARSQITQEMEGPHRQEIENIRKQYEGLIKHSGESSEQAEFHMRDNFRETLENKDKRFLEAFGKQARDQQVQLQEVKGRHDLERTELVGKNERDKLYAEKAQEGLRDRSGKERVAALSDQANAFNDAAKRTAAQKSDELHRAQEMANMNQKGDRPWAVPPMLEKQIRDQTEAQYGKIFKVEQERHQNDRDHIFETYRGKLMRLNAEGSNQIKTRDQEFQLQTQRERNAFGLAITDLETTRDIALKDAEIQKGRERDALEKSFMRSMLVQKAQYEDVIQDLRAQSQNRAAEVRLDANLRERDLQRQFAIKYNDATREAARKLQEKEEDAAIDLHNQRYELDKRLKESEKNFTMMLEDQAKSFEMRLHGQEIQAKDRERSIIESYENALEKVRRSNELLVKKKG